MGSGGNLWEDQDSISLDRMNRKTLYTGAVAPSPTLPCMLWFDAVNDKLYERNSNNNAWLQIYPVVTTGLVTQTEVDFGNLNYVTDQAFVITDVNVTTASHITAQLAYEAPTDKDLDEVEMDNIVIECGQYATGSFTMYIRGLEGSLYGKFKINYMIG